MNTKALSPCVNQSGTHNSPVAHYAPVALPDYPEYLYDCFYCASAPDAFTEVVAENRQPQ